MTSLLFPAAPPSSSQGFSSVVKILFACMVIAPMSLAQVQFPTGHSDNQRTGSNVNETLLAPTNVSKNNFGRLFNYPIEYQALAQPLYMPGVNIAGIGTHNVVYVATMADSVYAFDADSNQGANANPLWYVNFTDPANGITTASVATNSLPCSKTETSGPGFTQEGIISTPVIDPTTGTLYAVAKTLENGTVYHRLHALDITSGAEKFGGPVLITATSVSNKGTQMVMNSLHQKNRPGLLLSNGVLYLGFGSNYCNDHDTGWVLAYDAGSLEQVGVFNTSPDIGFASVWQTGNGMSADEFGNIYASTAESANYDVPEGGQSYSNSVLQLSPTTVTLTDYFTPWNVAYLNSNDLDVSSFGPLVLPDQGGPYPHELIASGKVGEVYLINRDAMGMFSPSDNQVIEDFSLKVGGELMASAAYWNGMVYFAPDGAPVQVYQISNGWMTPFASTPQNYVGSHSPSVSANGTTNGILWFISGGSMYAMDAVSLKVLYSTKQIPSRDQLPSISHFITQTVADGKVFIATRTTLEVFGLYGVLNSTGGANQSAQVLTPVPNPITFQAASPYTGAPITGTTVTFNDGGKGGSFNPVSAVTDGSGNVSTIYTFPKKAANYTITASASSFGSLSVTETAVSAPATRLFIHTGNKQTGNAGTVLAQPLVVQVSDAYLNGVPGITVAFDDQGKGGTFNPTSAVSNAQGLVQTTYQLPNLPGRYAPRASSSGLKTVVFSETGVVGPPASVTVTGGNNQTAPAGTQLPQALTVVVADQVGNPVSGASVTYSDAGAGGAFSNANPVTTNSAGTASQLYTLPPTAGTVSITATASGVSNPASFTETGQ